MNSVIVEAFSQIAREKNIDKDQLAEILEGILTSMIKKKYGTSDNFDIFVNMERGEIEIYQNKTIVEEVQDEIFEIDIESARSTEPTLAVGDEFLEKVNPASFGRRLIISAKQNLSQRIKDIEKELIYDEYSNRLEEIIIGDVRQISRGDVYINIDRTEVVLPRREQIPTEKYRRGDNVRAIVKEVKKTVRGPEIIVSRSDPKFLVRLFELEVPEIYDGLIEIKRIVRDAGERAKIAVVSHDKRIDAVGACVGMKGIRIQSIVRELNNEKIDIFEWASETSMLISRALGPAKPLRVIVDEEDKRAVAVLPDDQISLAIGRLGQNRKLASRLTDYNIETIKESQYRELLQAEQRMSNPVDTLTGLSSRIIKKLIERGLMTVEDVLQEGVEDLMDIPGIGEKTAEKIIESAKQVISVESGAE